MIRCSSSLYQPASPARASWCFLVLPATASRKLASRGQVAVAGTLNGQDFKAMLDPDGEGSHWLKVSRALRIKAGAEVGDRVALAIAPTTDVPEPSLPLELRKALSNSADAKVQWCSLTARQRHDWVLWITSAKREKTRSDRVASACDRLASGKRKVCCFDRSGLYSKSLPAPRRLVEPDSQA